MLVEISIELFSTSCLRLSRLLVRISFGLLPLILSLSRDFTYQLIIGFSQVLSLETKSTSKRNEAATAIFNSVSCIWPCVLSISCGVAHLFVPYTLAAFHHFCEYCVDRSINLTSLGLGSAFSSDLQPTESSYICSHLTCTSRCARVWRVVPSARMHLAAK